MKWRVQEIQAVDKHYQIRALEASVGLVTVRLYHYRGLFFVRTFYDGKEMEREFDICINKYEALECCRFITDVLEEKLK